MSPWISEASVILGATLVSFVLLCILNSVWRFHIITSGNASSPDTSALHPLETELLKRMASALKEPEQVSILMLQTASADEIPAVREKIQKMLRKEDVLAVWDDHTLGAVLRTSAPEAAWERIERLLQHPVAVGYATLTSQTRSADELIETALQRLREPGEPPSTSSPESEQSEEIPSPATTAPHLDPVSGAIHPSKTLNAFQKFSAKYRKMNQPVTCFFIDVDMLSRYNNHYGDDVGDLLLKNLVRMLEESVREEDLIGRMEDDSFLIATVCDPEYGHHIARRICYHVKQSPVTYSGKRLKITVCIGFAGIPRDHSTPRVVVNLAKQACRKSQESGYGRWAAYSEALQQHETTEEAKDSF